MALISEETEYIEEILQEKKVFAKPLGTNIFCLHFHHVNYCLKGSQGDYTHLPS